LTLLSFFSAMLIVCSTLHEHASRGRACKKREDVFRCLCGPRKDHRGVDLISDALPFGRLWYGEPNAISNAGGYAKHHSCSHDAVFRVYDEAGDVIEAHEQVDEFKEC
jgi:hypothetical protein